MTGDAPLFIQIVLWANMAPPSRRGTESIALSPDFPDDSRSGVNVGAFPAFRQDSREVRTATRTSGSPNGGRGADLATSMAFGNTRPVARD
jgi:hypothetical protein